MAKTLIFRKEDMIPEAALTVHSQQVGIEQTSSHLVTFSHEGKEVGIQDDGKGKLMFVYSECTEKDGVDIVTAACKVITRKGL